MAQFLPRTPFIKERQADEQAGSQRSQDRAAIVQHGEQVRGVQPIFVS